jgi:SnoaL-like domain
VTRWPRCSTTSTPTPPPRTSTQSTLSLDGDRATGDGYCLAHHLSVGEDGRRTMMIASIRYLDELVKQDGQWLFAERRLMVDWTETRPSAI